MVMGRAVAAGVLAVGVFVAGCSAEVEAPPAKPGAAVEAQADPGPVVADPVEWDRPVVVAGVGGDVEVALTGVRYVSGEEISSPTEHDHPARAWFVAVRFTVAAVGEEPVTVPSGWDWRLGGQIYGRGDGGHAGTAPWMGAVPEVLGDTALLPGQEPTAGYATFDVPEQGGEVAFTDAQGAMWRWTAPAQDAGQTPELDDWLTGQ